MNNPISDLIFAWLNVAALIFGVAASASHAYAQEPLVTVNVPFDFQEDSQLLKAGRYTLSLESEHFLHLQGRGIHSLAMSRPETNTPSSRSKLVFHAYGNRYFLREVWQANNSEHQVLAKSKAEKHVQAEETLAKRIGSEVALLEAVE